MDGILPPPELSDHGLRRKTHGLRRKMLYLGAQTDLEAMPRLRKIPIVGYRFFTKIENIQCFFLGVWGLAPSAEGVSP